MLKTPSRSGLFHPTQSYWNKCVLSSLFSSGSLFRFGYSLSHSIQAKKERINSLFECDGESFASRNECDGKSLGIRTNPAKGEMTACASLYANIFASFVYGWDNVFVYGCDIPHEMLLRLFGCYNAEKCRSMKSKKKLSLSFPFTSVDCFGSGAYAL